MSVFQQLAHITQERELEKVNAFYLQKEAEVGASTDNPPDTLDPS